MRRSLYSILPLFHSSTGTVFPTSHLSMVLYFPEPFISRIFKSRQSVLSCPQVPQGSSRFAPTHKVLCFQSFMSAKFYNPRTFHVQGSTFTGMFMVSYLQDLMCSGFLFLGFLRCSQWCSFPRALLSSVLESLGFKDQFPVSYIPRTFNLSLLYPPGSMDFQLSCIPMFYILTLLILRCALAPEINIFLGSHFSVINNCYCESYNA